MKHLEAVIATQLMTTLLASSVLLPIIGLYFYPKIVGLYIILPYALSVLLGKRPEKNGEGSPWRYFSENFPYCKIMRKHLLLSFSSLPKEFIEMEKKPNAQFIIGIGPHGVNSDFRILMEGKLSEIMPNTYERTRALAATVLFCLPLVRQISLWTGCIDASKAVAKKALSKNKILVIVPGGEQEQLMSTPGIEQLYLQKRKGFVKLALEYKIPLVPMYVFGSNDIYKTDNKTLYKLRYWLMKNLGVCICLYKGLYGWTGCPFPIKNTIVVGKPICVYENMIQKREKEGGHEKDTTSSTLFTKEEVDEAHELYCKAIVSLFDEHKERLGYGDRTLILK